MQQNNKPMTRRQANQAQASLLAKASQSKPAQAPQAPVQEVKALALDSKRIASPRQTIENVKSPLIHSDSAFSVPNAPSQASVMP